MPLTMEMRNGFPALHARVEAARAAALQVGGAVILRVAQVRVPFDTGELLGSGQVTAADGNRVAISFGDGDSAAYAVIQHEDLSLHHPHGGQAKFLESAANDTKAAQLVAMGQVIGKALTL